jgi:hypothetical protein
MWTMAVCQVIGGIRFVTCGVMFPLFGKCLMPLDAVPMLQYFFFCRMVGFCNQGGLV